jgi:hypothetical protein
MVNPDPEEGPQQHTVTGPLLLDVVNAANPGRLIDPVVQIYVGGVDRLVDRR